MPLRSLREYFRSHPPARERIATLEKEIQARGYNAAQALKPLGVRAIFLAEQAEVLDRHGMFDRAIARYQEALKADREYWMAWEGLAKAKWRSGDADGAANAAMEALGRKSDMPRLWELLAKSLAASDRNTAAEQFRARYRTMSAKLTEPVRKQIEMESAGLEFFAGRPQAMEIYQKTLASGLDSSIMGIEFAQRRRVAWWMWRAGKAQEALKELEAARQQYPQGTGVGTEMAWALSDMGRQADALERMEGSMATGGVVVTPQGVSSNLYRPATGDGESEALAAVISWRTGQRNEAKLDFQRAAEADPVWMVSKWVANNYSAEATAVIAKLQAEEMARRKKEEAKKTAAGKR
jgi:tetratricopeptide (TPR) repeat protein